ncbi:hypothetical protein AWENTII_003508 [Aspergillus wentii]
MLAIVSTYISYLLRGLTININNTKKYSITSIEASTHELPLLVTALSFQRFQIHQWEDDTTPRILVRIAFIYLDEGLWTGNGVSDVVEKLHAHGWSFGEGKLRFNCSLGMFYLAQLAAAIYRYSSQLEGDFPSSDFPTYTAHHALLHSSVWRSYYSLPFLTQHTTARFYRLPDLQDLPDSSPLCQPRHRPVSTNILKLPRWAYPIECTRRRQPFLPFATLTAVALSTLETTMARLHTAYPSAPPYSESHARFWLDYFTPNPSRLATVTPQEGPNRFGVLVAQGMYDIHGLEAEYLAQVSEGEGAEGAGESEPVMWCGLPDDAEEREAGQGGCGNHGAVCTRMAGHVAWCRGEGEDAAADPGGECAALCTLESLKQFMFDNFSSRAI